MDLNISPKVTDNEVWCVCQWMTGIESLHKHMPDPEAWKIWRDRIMQIQRAEVERLARHYFDAGRELQKKLDA